MCVDTCVCAKDRVGVCVNEWPFKAIKIRLVGPEFLIIWQALPLHRIVIGRRREGGVGGLGVEVEIIEG